MQVPGGSRQTHGIMRLNERIIHCNDLHVAMLYTAKGVSNRFPKPRRRRKSKGGGRYALRKTIRPIRPKPLIPTRVSDIIDNNEVDVEIAIKCRMGRNFRELEVLMLV